MSNFMFPILTLFVVVVYVVNRIRSNRRFKR